MNTRRLASVALGMLALLPAVASAQTAIRVGQTVSGTLTAQDPLAQDQTPYDDFVIATTPGQRLTIIMSSDAFDTWLVFGTGTGGSFSQISYDDDGGGGTNSRLVVTATGTRHTIRANAVRQDARGAYTVSVQADGGGAPGPNLPGPPRPQAGGQQTITAGQPVNGRLDASDQRASDGSYFDTYYYRGRPGERITVTLRSSDFDAFLAGGAASASEFSETDDDGGGGTDSRLTGTVPPDGVYEIRANSLGAGETGAYTLSLISAGGGGGPAPSGGPAGTIAVGSSVSGRLDSSDRRLSDNSHYDQYTVRGQPGQSVIITMTSDAFDAFLQGGPGQGAQFQAQDADDDGGGGTNARLQVNLDRSGAYTVQANSYGAGATGAYSLLVEAGGTVAGGNTPAPGGTIALGQTVTGRLDTSDPTLPDNSHYDQHVYRGTPGQTVVITMTSTAFDAFLAWGRLNGTELVTEGTDDDGGGGTNAQVVATVPANGAIVIQANSLGAGETGPYTLRVAAATGSGAPAPTRNVPAGAATVAAGQSVSGSLAASDPMLADSSFFDTYVYQGNPGDRIRITMQSSAFDTYLLWGRMNGSTLDVEEQDDDGAGGTNSQLEVQVGGTGTYAIRANSVAKGETGAYTLRVERLAAGAPSAPGRTAPTPGRQTTGPASGSSGKWRYQYVSATNPQFRNLEQRMKEDQFLESFATQLTARFALPASASGVDLRLDQCGQVNAFYSPRDKRITFCYELLQHLARIFVADGRWTPEQHEQVGGAVRFIMMHEVGHALVDVMDLPITGREEDAVDQLATMMLIRSSEKGAQEAIAGVMALQPGENATFDDSDFADEHSLGPVRLYNVLCWIYGSDRQKNSHLVERGHLPRERAVRCPSEWEQLEKSWTRLLEQ